jgi:hypothetical protein
MISKSSATEFSSKAAAIGVRSCVAGDNTYGCVSTVGGQIYTSSGDVRSSRAGLLIG